MALLEVERIKLFSTRAAWWCVLVAIIASVGFAALIGAFAGDDFPITIGTAEMGYNFGLMAVMVLAVLAITTEYRFGTIKTTFQAAPNRTAVLVSKAVVLAVLSGVIGEVVAFGSWWTSTAVKPGVTPNLVHSSADWRAVLGIGVVYAFGAVLALGIGALVRQTAAAVTIVLVQGLLLEDMMALVPGGTTVQRWMPFQAAHWFLTGGVEGGGPSPGPRHMPFGPWGGLAYFAVIALGLFAAAIVVVNRRDA